MIGTSELVLGDTTDVTFLRQLDIQKSLLSQQWLQCKLGDDLQIYNASAISNWQGEKKDDFMSDAVSA